MSCEILLISEGIKGEIYAEPGTFESKVEPIELRRSELEIILSLTGGWKHKTDIQPANPRNATMYIWRINQKIPRLIINDKTGRYRINPSIIVVRNTNN